jgi:hypothetical protein
MSNPYDNATERVSVLGPTLHFKGEVPARRGTRIHLHPTWAAAQPAGARGRAAAFAYNGAPSQISQPE